MRQHTRGVRASPYRPRDGDRQGRAADHRPRPARPVRLPPAGRDGRRRGRQRRAGARSGGSACSASSSSWPRPPSCRRSASPSRSRRSRRGVPAELVRLGLWVAREYCSTPSRGLRLVLPPGAGVRKRRARPRVEHAGVGAAAAGAPKLLPEQEEAVGRGRRRPRRGGRAPTRAAPARGHRLGQDRGLPGRGRGGAGAGEGGDRPRPRDRPRPAGGGPLPRPARRPRRRPALGPHRRRALRRVAAAAQRRGERLRRPALGGLRPGPRPRPDRDRRGARPLLQAGGRPLLRRPHGRPPPRRASAARCWSPAPRRRGRSPGWSCRGSSCRAGSTGGGCRRSRSSTCAAPTRAPARCTPPPGRRWRACAEPAPRRS